MFKKFFLYSFIVYTLLGFIGVPFVLKPQVIKIVGEETNAKISIEKIRFNPFLFKLSLYDVSLNSLENKPLVKFKLLLVDLELYSLINKAIHVKELVLSEPKIDVVYNKDKTLNILNILKPQTAQVDKKSDETSTIPRIIIDKIEILRGDINYKDFTLKDEFAFSFHDLGFKLEDIDTNDFNSSDAQFRFYSSLGDGGFVDFKTKVVGFKPLILEGNLNFVASKLYTEWKYMKEQLNLEVADGKISFNANYHLNLENLDAMSIDNLNLSVNKLRIIPKNKIKDVLNLDSLYVTNVTIKPLMQDVHIEKIGLHSLSIKAKRDKHGDMDWLEYIKIKGGDENQTTTQKPMQENTPWNIRIDDLALEKISLAFEDSRVSPKVTSKLNTFNLYAQKISLDSSEPFTYQADLVLNDSARCDVTGTVIQKILDIKTHAICKGFDLVHYKPYIDQIAKSELEVYNLNLKSSIVGFDTKVHIKDINKTISIVVDDTNASLSKFALAKRSNSEKLVTFSSFKLSGIHVDSLKEDVKIHKVALNKLVLNSARYSNGKLNLENLVVLKKKKSKKKSKVKKSNFKLKINAFALNAAKINFRDKALSPMVKSVLDKIQLNAYSIDIKRNSWLKYKLSARVNSKGVIKSAGKLRHTPLMEKGTFELKNIQLKDITPYLQEKAFVSVDDGKLSLKAKTFYAKSSKNPDLKIDGSVSLEDFFVNDSRDKSLLLSLNSLKVKTFNFELSPNRLYVDEIDLKSFYVDAVIDENKQMNFAKLTKTTDANESNTTVKNEEGNATQEVAFPVKILKVNIIEGNAKFADYSIPLKFKTDIHDLNGAIYAISNAPDEVSYIDIHGDVDEYGSTKLKGSINSANPKAYTDIDFNFKNLELNALSGYSASFAGHEIDSGKLFLDLGYKIKDSELLGKNNMMIKNIKLGREVDDENVTVLPLGFVIALLEDSDGIIDIDMPVEGNLDAPDFKYGALLWKTFGKLIVSAVTSPFRFLGSMMGMDGDSLEYAEFEMGSTVILPTEREKIDNIAKMMLKRPKIKLLLTPIYDEVGDKKALQLAKLTKIIMKKSGNTSEEKNENAMTVDLLEDIYEEYKDDDTLDKLSKKLETQYKDEAYDREYRVALIRLCRDIQNVSIAELELLATNRVKNITTYLENEKEVDTSRLILNKPHGVQHKEDRLLRLGLEVQVK